MIVTRRYFTAAYAGFFSAALIAAGCTHRATVTTGETPVTAKSVVSPSAPPTIVVGGGEPPAAAMPDTLEPRVDLDMVDAPVTLVLQRLAQIGGLQLIVPTNLNRTVSVAYVNVPVSEALKDVLSRSGLRLGPAPRPNLPFDTVTVFYQLPANVDSMSVTAIMLRFGISKGLAELLVSSRRP